MTIRAQIIADSIDTQGVRLITLELEYPRFIHSELMTHRVFSRNSASSRAIPIKTMLDNVSSNPAQPVHWGKNQTGMQAKEELNDEQKGQAKEVWMSALQQAVLHSAQMNEIGVHKQIANRITEPFQHMKVVVSSTEWNNWDWLRYHPDAQPEIKELAHHILQARKFSNPQVLNVGEWHLPYVATKRNKSGILEYFDEANNKIAVNQAIMISASCCAQTSYRKSDTSLEKAEAIYKRLIESEPCHASPVEHQATVADYSKLKPKDAWPEGVTHIDRKGMYWSGNFRSWIQYRQLIPNNARNG
jgi:thymidylate synthase ThyX